MKAKITLFILVLFVLMGCGRTYHVYIIARDGSTVTQTIEVLADVPKTIDVNTDVSAPLTGEQKELMDASELSATRARAMLDRVIK